VKTRKKDVTTAAPNARRSRTATPRQKKAPGAVSPALAPGPPTEPQVAWSSGNIFADMGLPDADELLVKADLATHIGRAIKARNLTQRQAGEMMGIDQPKVSAIVRGRLDGFSSDRLLRYLNDLGCDVEIRVSEPNPDARGLLVCA
jgi:predicted XRE-type DNA-binding protein